MEKMSTASLMSWSLGKSSYNGPHDGQRSSLIRQTCNSGQFNGDGENGHGLPNCLTKITTSGVQWQLNGNPYFIQMVHVVAATPDPRGDGSRTLWTTCESHAQVN